MKKQSLNGKWLYRIGYGTYGEITVPFSRLPVGHSECIRTFDLCASSARIFLIFEGITYYAKVILNGKELGEMLPYCEYTFDITDTVKMKDNRLEVLLEDISPSFAPSEVWENHGGIIRGVHLEFYGDACIDGVLKKAPVTSDSLEYCEYCSDSSDLAEKNVFVCRNEDNGYERLCEDLLTTPASLSQKRPEKEMKVGPIFKEAKQASLTKQPFTLFDGGILIYEGEGENDTVTLIGAVSAVKGYPISGEYGEAAAAVKIICEDGSEEEFILRNGMDFTTIFTALASSRIDPRAENASRFALFDYDKNFENYVINRLDLKLSGKKRVTKVEIRSLNKGYDLPIYGIYV